MLIVKQGKRCATDYALGFCTLAAGNRWNELAIKAAFCQEVHTELDCCDDHGFLGYLAIHHDKLIQYRQAYLL